MIKVKLHNEKPLNLLLCGGEIWSGNAADANACEVLHHKGMVRILKISMMRVKEHRIRNKLSANIF